MARSPSRLCIVCACFLFFSDLAAGQVSPKSTADTGSPLLVYENMTYGWWVSYPKGWKVDDSKPVFVLIQSPDQNGHCGIHTAGVQFKAAAEFADLILTGREKHFGDVKSLFRKPVRLPSGLTGIESLADIQGIGRSRQIFAVVDGTGYIVDCETEIPDWEEMAPSFDQVIRSFSIPNLAALSDADTSPPQNFTHPRHGWSIAYPGGWRLDTGDPDGVALLRQDAREVPDTVDYAGCRVMSRAVQASSLEDFADGALRRNAEGMQEDGIQVRVVSRKSITLSNGIAGIDVMREMSSGRKSRNVFILTDGMSYIVDCETSARMWDTLAPLFEQILVSFTLQTGH